MVSQPISIVDTLRGNISLYFAQRIEYKQKIDMLKHYICMCTFKQKAISCNLIKNYYSSVICSCTKRISCTHAFDNNNISFYLKIILSRLFQYWRLCSRIVIICEQIKGSNFNWIEKDGFDILILMLITVFSFKIFFIYRKNDNIWGK